MKQKVLIIQINSILSSFELGKKSQIYKNHNEDHMFLNVTILVWNKKTKIARKLNIFKLKNQNPNLELFNSYWLCLKFMHIRLNTIRSS